MNRFQALAGLLAVMLAASPQIAWAQGFDFGEEEAEAEPEPETGGGEGEGEVDVDTQDPAGLDFNEQDAERTTYSDSAENHNIAIVAVPGEFMDSDRRQKVQAELEKRASDVGVSAAGGAPVLGTLEASGGEDCVREPLCLADVGEQSGADRILLARVVQGPDGSFNLTVDYFDVEDKLFIRSHTEEGLGGTGAIVDAVETSVNKVLDVRDLVAGPNVVDDEDSGVVQTVLAYSTAGLAVGALAAGIVFGLKAKSIEKEVSGRPKNGDVYVMTQTEARDAIRPAQSAATSANVFYGLSVALGLTSALLFFIQGGSDVAADQGTGTTSIRDLQIAPAVTADGFGFGASFRF